MKTSREKSEVDDGLSTSSTPSPQPETFKNSTQEKVFFDNRIKRKNVLALNEKVAAIREYEKVPIYKRVGRMFHCSPDQIKRIVQQKDTILKAWEQRTRRCQDAKTLQTKVVRVSMLGKAVYEWIRRMMYYQDINIRDGLIQKMALQFKSAMGLQNFFPDTEWCNKFRQTYNIIETDSKLLGIGYTQGFSVQIKDVIKDVLSECNPDADDDDDDDDNNNDNNNNNDADDRDRDAHIDETIDENQNERKTDKNNRNLHLKKTTTIAMQQKDANCILPNLQPLRQLVALPIQAGAIGTTQKVLVATPIQTGGHKMSNTPMTMTIIPLATLSQPGAQQMVQQQQMMHQDIEPTVPQPMPEIKQEIKTEPMDDIEIKQEIVSDSEEMNEELQEINMKVAKEISYDSKNSDDDNIVLSKLRKSVRNSNRINSLTSPTPSPSLPPTVTIPRTIVENLVPRELRSPPPLIRAPSTVLNGTITRKRRCNETVGPPAIQTNAQARKYLKMLEDFALYKENYRLIGLITRADETLRELDGDDDVDID